MAKTIWAKTASSARKKAKMKTRVITKVKLLKSKKPKKGMKCYTISSRMKKGKRKSRRK